MVKETGRLATDGIHKGTFIWPLLLGLPSGHHFSSQTLHPTFQFASDTLPSQPSAPPQPPCLLSLRLLKPQDPYLSSPFSLWISLPQRFSLMDLGIWMTSSLLGGGQDHATLLISPTGQWTACRRCAFCKGEQVFISLQT